MKLYTDALITINDNQIRNKYKILFIKLLKTVYKQGQKTYKKICLRVIFQSLKNKY